MSHYRPETSDAKPGDKSFCPTNGTAYLMIYEAVKSKDSLISGRLHYDGESCAIGSFWDVNPKCTLKSDLIDEVAAINDSVPTFTRRQRRSHVLRWLRWKLQSLGYPLKGPKATRPAGSR